jgi:hypothetical protein
MRSSSLLLRARKLIFVFCKIWEISRPEDRLLDSLGTLCSVYICRYSVTESVSVKKRVAYRLMRDIWDLLLLLLAGWWRVKTKQHTLFRYVRSGICDMASRPCSGVGTKADWGCRMPLVYRHVGWAMNGGRRRHCIPWIHLHRNNYCTAC